MSREIDRERERLKRERSPALRRENNRREETMHADEEAEWSNRAEKEKGKERDRLDSRRRDGEPGGRNAEG